jgi:N-acetyl-anhydromuramyl-L-alanine amidase AmpD
MNIIEKTYTLNGKLTKRTKTDTIVLHHRAGNGDVESIDRIHKNQDWSCIGYHFYVRKDGTIYRGRQEDAVGAHAYGSNSTSIGICAEGNFEKDIMSEAQKQSIKELVAYLKEKYNITKVIRHKDVNATACPRKELSF